MSYFEMDHAKWVQANIDGHRRDAERSRKPLKVHKDRYGDRMGWSAAPERLTDHQARIFDIIGMTFGGIYNAPLNWNTVDWNLPGGGIGCTIRAHSLATWDFHTLTLLVLLCHMARIRCDLDVYGRDYRLLFFPRSHQGGNSERHPNIAEAVASLEAAVPASSRVRYDAARHDPLPGAIQRNMEFFLLSAAEHADRAKADCFPLEERRKAAEEAKRRADIAARNAERLPGLLHRSVPGDKGAAMAAGDADAIRTLVAGLLAGPLAPPAAETVSPEG